MMGFMFLCIFLTFIVGSSSISLPDRSGRSCRNGSERCEGECPDGTYEYLSACQYRTREPTCDVPEPLPILDARLCDYSACYCEPPTVRNKKTNKCIPLDKCPSPPLPTTPIPETLD